jgi:hypothetical protein
MARVLVDDLDHTVHTEEVPVMTRHFAFGLAGQMTTYSVDLTEQNYQRLVEALQPFLDLEGTEEVEGSGTSDDEPAKARSKDDLAAIRLWAKNTNHKVASKGRIAGDILAAYDKANKKS